MGSFALGILKMGLKSSQNALKMRLGPPPKVLSDSNRPGWTQKGIQTWNGAR